MKTKPHTVKKCWYEPQIKKVIMIEENRGDGTKESPVRNVMFFYQEETLYYLGYIDPHEQNK